MYRLYWLCKFGREDQKEEQNYEKKKMPQTLKGRRQEQHSIPYASWALTDGELTAVLHHFDVEPSLGFAGLNETAIKLAWSQFMTSDLYNWWLAWLIGHHDVQPPKSYRRLCDLLKSHTEGSLPYKAMVITRVVHNKDTCEIIKEENVSHHEFSRYFQKIISTYIKYFYITGDQNSRRWRNASRDFDTNITSFISFVVEFYLTEAKFQGIYSKILFLLEVAPFFDDISSATVAFCFGYGTVGYFIPRLVAGIESIISVTHATFFSYLLKSESDDSFKWEMIYNSNIHGISNKVFYEYVSTESSSMIFIRDFEGYIFGAYIDAPWQKGPEFFGGTGCFLFRIHPDLIICQAYGINTNFCYFNFNDSHNPKGVGFGGSKEFFGLHIDLDSCRGKSADFCSTYKDFICLPHYKYFDLKDVEVWTVMLDAPMTNVEVKGREFLPLQMQHILQ